MDLESCRKKLEKLEAARETLLKLTREMKINATKAIASIHSNQDFSKHLNRALEIMEEVYKFKKEYPEIYYAITHDSMQEVVEAYCLSKVVNDEFKFEFDELKAEPAAIVTGLADLIGELRRCALTKLMKGEFDDAEKLIKLMEKIYFELISFSSFPDRLVPNLRPKLDVARGSIERTKSDYIAAKVARLNEALDRT